MRMDTRSTGFRAYAVCAGLMVFFIPVVLAVSGSIFVKAFIPTDAVAPLAWPIAIIFALVALSIFVPLLASSVDLRTLAGVKQNALIAFGGLVGGAMGLLFVGELPYLLHIGADAVSTRSVETVVSVKRPIRTRRGQWCGNGVVLAGDRTLVRRRLCWLDDAMFEAIKPGDKLVLSGVRSRYGLLVDDIAMAPSARSAPPAEKGGARISLRSLDGSVKRDLCFSNEVNHGLLEASLRLTFADAKELGRTSVAKPGAERLALVSVYSDETRKLQAIARSASLDRHEVEVEGFRVLVPSARGRQFFAVQENGLVAVSLHPSRLESPQWTLDHQVGPLLRFVTRSIEQCKSIPAIR